MPKFKLSTESLSFLQIEVLMSALSAYGMSCSQNAVYCDSHDLPDLKRMWLARAEAAEDVRKGV